MKLSVITDEISMDFAHALDVMREYGATGAELRSLWGRNLVDLSREDIGNAQEILRERGFKVSCLASPIFKCRLEPETTGSTGATHQARERTLVDQPALIERCADLADMFGARLVRIFAFWKSGALTEKIEDQIVEQLSIAAEIAGRLDIILALENEHSCLLSTGQEVARAVQRVNSPYLKAVWDPGNAFCAGEEPFPDGYEAIREHIIHVHLKDAIRLQNGDCRFVAIGDGHIDYPGQIRALEADGYDGWLSLETHYAPLGGDGEDGSRHSLAVLRNTVCASGKAE